MAFAKPSRLKPLLPSLKEKKRYLRFEILSSDPIKQEDAFRSIWNSVLSLHGEAGTAKAGLWIVPDKYDAQAQSGLLRVAHDAVDHVKAGLALITTIGTTPALVQVTRVSGMISKA